MAFVGVPVIQNLGSRVVRITGVTLAAGGSGTIGGNGDAGADIQLPASGQAVEVISSIVTVSQETPGALVPFTVAKGGAPVRATITNADGANASGNLEIYLNDLHSIVR